MSYGGEQLLWLQEGGGTADGASKRDRSAGDSNDERGVKRAAEPSQAQGAPRKKATPGPRVKSRICQVVGCNIEYSSTHECRARACQTHCSALSVRLEGQDPEQQFRFCYQCHKFHELDAFRNPDGTLRPRHNCYQSQALRLDRRKKKDAAAKASKKKLDIAAVLEAQSGHIIDAVNRASNVAASNLILANVMEVMEVAKATQQTIANAQQRPYTHPSQQLPHRTKPGAAATAFAPAVSSFDPGFTASSSGAEGRVPGDHPSGPSRRASPLDLTAIDDKRRQRRATHVMGDAAGVTTTLAARGGESRFVVDASFESQAHGFDGGAQATTLFCASPSLGHPASGGDVASGAGGAAATIDGTRFEELSHEMREEAYQQGFGRDGRESSPDLLHSLLSGTPVRSK